MTDYKIYQGDCLDVLKTLESESVQTCVTSPPYFQLRNYGIDGQIGLEETPAEFVASLVAVFEEVKRVLRPDGTLWLNLGDSYAGSGRGLNADGSHSSEGTDDKQSTNHGSLDVGRAVNEKSFSKNLIEKGAIGNAWVKPPKGLKQKDLIGIPWRVAFALQDAGWYLRQDIIWSKPNPMPESVTDRCTKAHEYIFLLTKNAKYYYDNEAIKTPLKDASVARLIQDVESQNGSERVPGKSNGNMKAVAKGRDRSNGNRNGEGASTLDYKNLSVVGRKDHSFHTSRIEGKEWQPSMAGSGVDGHSGYFDAEGNPLCGVMANKKSVWTVTTQPYRDAHFATFPEKLIEPCILAGSREGDVVLDPFNGAGTTGLVSLKHRREYIGIELNPAYIAIAEKRLSEIQVKLF